MRKRKINPQHLRRIVAQDVNDEKIAALDFAISLKKFADEYLRGILELDINGTSPGTVNLKLPVASYLVRLLCECGDRDELIRASLELSDELTLLVNYSFSCPADDVARIVQVARLAGFRVERDGSVLIFKAPITAEPVMRIYAVSQSEFQSMLVYAYKM